MNVEVPGSIAGVKKFVVSTGIEWPPIGSSVDSRSVGFAVESPDLTWVRENNPSYDFRTTAYLNTPYF